jgi:hypothetical protein
METAVIKWLVLYAVALTGLLLMSAPVAAHTEGTMQLAAVPAGPYMLTVWTSPDPASSSEDLHVALAVVLAEDASPVLEADVQVQLTPEGDGPVISGPATIENSENKFLHEAILDVGQSGDYLVEIFVEGADGGFGQASFPLQVEGGSGLNWTLILVAVAVVASAVILIGRYRRNPDMSAGPPAR